jgi:predicted kinase
VCIFRSKEKRYRLSYRIARDNLFLGKHVIADSCNTIGLTRIEWQEVAVKAQVQFINIEVVCSDIKEHKYRAEHRKSNINNLTLPTWKQIQGRHYENWETPVLQIDTAHHTPAESLLELLYTMQII